MGTTLGLHEHIHTQVSQSIHSKLLQFSQTFSMNDPQQDTAISMVPYFRVQDGKMDEMKELLGECMELTKNETGCYSYSYNLDEKDVVYCREVYKDIPAVVAHLENMKELMEKTGAISEIFKFELHASKAQIDTLRANMAPLFPPNSSFYELDTRGIRASAAAAPQEKSPVVANSHN